MRKNKLFILLMVILLIIISTPLIANAEDVSVSFRANYQGDKFLTLTNPGDSVKEAFVEMGNVRYSFTVSAEEFTKTQLVQSNDTILIPIPEGEYLKAEPTYVTYRDKDGVDLKRGMIFPTKKTPAPRTYIESIAATDEDGTNGTTKIIIKPRLNNIYSEARGFKEGDIITVDYYDGDSIKQEKIYTIGESEDIVLEKGETLVEDTVTINLGNNIPQKYNNNTKNHNVLPRIEYTELSKPKEGKYTKVKFDLSKINEEMSKISDIINSIAYRFSSRDTKEAFGNAKDIVIAAANESTYYNKTNTNRTQGRIDKAWADFVKAREALNGKYKDAYPLTTFSEKVEVKNLVELTDDEKAAVKTKIKSQIKAKIHPSYLEDINIIIKSIVVNDNGSVTVTYKDDTVNTLTQEQTVKKLEFKSDLIKSIEVTKQPNLEYTEKENLDLAGMEVTLTDKNEKTKVVKFNEFEENGITIKERPSDPLKVSDSGKVVKVQVNGFDGNPRIADTNPLIINEIPFNANKIRAIKVTAQPKLTYDENDNLDLNSLEVTLTDENWKTKIVKFEDFVNESITIVEKPSDPLKVSDDGKVVKVQVNGFDGNPLTDSTNPIIVNQLGFNMALIDSITITNPNKMDYFVGENLDLTGMEITLTDTNGKTKTINPRDIGDYGVVVNPASPLKLAENGKNISLTIPKTGGDISDSTPGAITVIQRTFDKDNIVEIEVKAPDKMDYIEGENLDLTGIEVTLTDKNGKTVTIGKDELSDYGLTIEPNSPLSLQDNGKAVKVSKIYQNKIFFGESDEKLSVEEKPVEVDKTGLEQAINDGKNKKSDDEYINASEDKKKDLDDAISKGEEVLADEDASQEEVNKAKKAIEDAIRDLEGEPDESDEVDKTGLEQAINDGKNKKTDDEYKNASEEKKKALDDAISKGEEVLADEDATQEEVNKAKKAIEDAISDLNGQLDEPVEVDKSGLKRSINRGENIQDSVDYKHANPNDKRELDEALDNGWKVYNDPDATQLEVDLAKKRIDDVIRNIIMSTPYYPSYPDKPYYPEFPGEKETVIIIKDKDTEKVSLKDERIPDGTHNNYLEGYPDGTIRPDDMITRTEAAILVARMLDLPLVDSSDTGFTDTPLSWYNVYINAVTKKGVMKGYPGGDFRPDDLITRGEFVTIISNFDEKSSGGLTFKDIEGHWAEKAIKQAANNGRVKGYADSTFKPDENITRGEAITILNRTFYRSLGEIGLGKVENPLEIKKFKDIDANHWAYYEILEATHNHTYKRLKDGRVDEEWIQIK